ncbi:MAG: tetratricopeptide repeat protein [Bdellovibrionota bacterium]
MIISLLLLLSGAFAENPSLVYKNNKAVGMFADEKLIDSKIQLEKEVVNYPKAGALHYNLGVVHENSKEPEKAIKEYLSTANSTEDQNLKFQSLFNAARVYGEQKNIPSALKYYQAALDIRPESEEVKNNIELLFQGNGGGGNDSDKEQKSDEQNKQDQKQQQQPKEPDQQKQDQNKKKAPKPFKSQDLSEQDVRRILDELKRQEEQIRAKMNDKKSKETPNGKDW